MSMEANENQSSRQRSWWPYLALFLILLVAGYLRFTGLNWDENTHLHPDERFLTMVETSIQPAVSLREYFTTATSPLNPRNRGHGFFVYGSFPIFLVRYVVRYVAEGLNNYCLTAGCTFNFLGYDGVHLVGRALSALADLATLVVLFFLGRRLYDERVGVLAALLGAGSVLSIQQSHFFTVDTYVALFATLSLYCAVRVAQDDRGSDWIWFGLAFGAALACKISVWPLGLVLVAAAWVRAVRQREPSMMRPFLNLAAAAILAFLVFRVLQPYAFTGLNFDIETMGEDAYYDAVAAAPGWWQKAYDVLPEPIRAVLLPAPRWLGNMRTIQSQVGGDVDFPPNHQWTDRRPIVFPWKNMVLYGMGPALGLTAWLGFAAAVLYMLIWIGRRKNWHQHLLPALWIAIFFLYQGTQWVKSMRYLLPIYPALILLGAWALVEGVRTVRRRWGNRRRWLVGVAWALPVLVVGLTLAWAFSFVNIYHQPTTRVAAARWIYENVPTGATLLYETDAGPAELQIPVPITEYLRDGSRNVTTFEMPVSGRVTGVRMNYLSDPNLDPEPETFFVAVSSDIGSESHLAAGVFSENLVPQTNVRGDAHTIAFEPVELAAGQSYYLITEAQDGAPVRSTGAFVVNESSWDDGLPLRIDGLDGFNIYEGSPLELYWEDNADKREQMIRLLDEADYLFITSSRQLGSIPRLPTRYPMTTAYYEALFDGNLGFEPVATFMADLHVGPLQINDVFGRLGWGEAPDVGWPPPGAWAAEEAFSVYDHPPVWIFAKTEEYDPVQTRAILEAVDLSQARFITPYEYTEQLKAGRRPGLLQWLFPSDSSEPEAEETRSMWLEPDVWAEQQAGGTWSELFDPEGLLSRKPAVGAAVWWALLAVIGWLAFPLASLVLGGLPSQGYVVSKILGLLLIAWMSWMLVSLGWLTYSRGTIYVAIGLLALVAVGVGLARRHALAHFVRTKWRLMLTVEVVGLALFVISLLIRSGNPDLWHPNYGGEKPMDFSFLNAVLKSTTFPPYDPWLAGAYINYYYFGFVMIGNLIKVLGIVPYVAYNIALPMLFALTGLGAFSISYDLVAGLARNKTGEDRPERRVWMRRALFAGLAAAVLAVLLGNLGQIWTFINGWHRLGAGEGGFLVETLRGLLENIKGNPLPIYTGSWYWDATRIIPPAQGEAGPITEFPFFTFLYADLHAHMIDMPLVLLALAWALGLAQRADRSGRRPVWRALPSLAVSWIVGALVIGALRATNTWDWPTQLGVGVVAVLYWAWRTFRPGWRWLAAAAAGIAALVGLSSLFFLPVTRNFVPAYTEVQRWQGGVTPAWAYFAVHGLFLFILLTVLGHEFRDWTRQLSDKTLERLEPWGSMIGLGVLILLLAMVALLAMGIPVGPLVLLLMAAAGLLALQSRLPAERRAVLMLLTLGLALTLAVEVIVLSGDISRMNTVFKFYLQVWLIFSAIGGAALVWAWQTVQQWRRPWRQVWLIGLGALVFTAALYPPTAAAAKFRDRFHADQPPAGLDGMQFMLTSTHYDQDQAIPLEDDYDAIRWLQDNVQGSPVIMEANTYPKIYGWGNRITMFTGLPSVVGWEWHTRQHRAGFEGATEEVRRRANDVIAFYNTPDVDQALNILQSYDVQYVIVGRLEQAYYSPVGLEKFDLMVELGMLQEVYRNPGAVIYQIGG